MMPEVGRSRPPSICSTVVLPCPVGPWMVSHSPSSITRSTPCSACTVVRPFWLSLVTPVSLYMGFSPGCPLYPPADPAAGSFDPGQGRRRVEPGRAPAAEHPGDQAARHGQHHGEDD